MNLPKVFRRHHHPKRQPFEEETGVPFCLFVGSIVVEPFGLMRWGFLVWPGLQEACVSVDFWGREVNARGRTSGSSVLSQGIYRNRSWQFTHGYKIFLLQKANYHKSCTAYIHDLKGWGEADSVVGRRELRASSGSTVTRGVGGKPVDLTQVCWVACHPCLISFFPRPNLNRWNMLDCPALFHLPAL